MGRRALSLVPPQHACIKDRPASLHANAEQPVEVTDFEAAIPQVSQRITASRSLKTHASTGCWIFHEPRQFTSPKQELSDARIVLAETSFPSNFGALRNCNYGIKTQSIIVNACGCSGWIGLLFDRPSYVSTVKAIGGKHQSLIAPRVASWNHPKRN